METTKSSERILVIKLAPYDSLVSSNMRMLALMKGLAQLGYSMDLLTVPKSNALVDNDMSDYSFLEQVNIVYTEKSKLYENMVAKKDRGLIKRFYPIAKRIYHRFSLYNHTDRVAKRISIQVLPAREYDYIIAVSDPKTTYIALEKLLSQGLKARKIIEYWGDPLYGDVTQKSLLPKFVIRKEEKKFLSMANKVVYTSPLTLKMEQKTYPSYADIMTCIPTANAVQKIFDKTNSAEYTVGYYGGYKSTVRNLVPMYEAFKDLQGIAKLNLVGDSDLNLLSTNNVIVRPRGVVKDLEEKTDLFVCVLNSSGTQIPGKVYHMAATNRPVLVVLDGELQDEIAEYLKSFNRFIMCQNNSYEIQKTIRDIIAMDKEWMPCERLAPAEIAKEFLQ